MALTKKTRQNMNRKNITTLILPLALMTMLGCFGNNNEDTPPSEKEKIIAALEGIKKELNDQEHKENDADINDPQDYVKLFAKLVVQLENAKKILEATQKSTLEGYITSCGDCQARLGNSYTLPKVPKNKPEFIRDIKYMKDTIDKVLKLLKPSAAATPGG